MASPSAAFSEQVMLRLESALVSSGKVVVVDRANLDKIRAEQGFQLSGGVDDDSAKAIGKLLGAGAIVTGSTADMGDVYGLALKAINIETATVAVSYLAELAKTERIKALMASGGGAAGTQSVVVASTVQAAPVTPAVAAPTPVEKVYKIGDTGPAGGIIFYDKGNKSGGWRYLEVAPSEAEFKSQWDPNNTRVSGTGTEIGIGKKNTQLMTDQFVVLSFRITGLDIGGHSDWFLPSKDELHLMYLTLSMKGLGGFKSENYWSSSEGNDAYHGAYYENFRDGSQDSSRDYRGGGSSGKPYIYSVRVIRQF